MLMLTLQKLWLCIVAANNNYYYRLRRRHDIYIVEILRQTVVENYESTRGNNYSSRKLCSVSKRNRWERVFIENTKVLNVF